jgi:hypothetical protein
MRSPADWPPRSAPLPEHRLGPRPWRPRPAGRSGPCRAAVDDVVVLVARVRTLAAGRHERGVGIGGADADIGRAPVGPARRGTVGPARLPDPGVAGVGALGEGSPCLLGQGERQFAGGVGVPIPIPLATVAGGVAGEEPSQMGFAGAPRPERRERGIGSDLGCVDGLAPGPRPIPGRRIARQSARRSGGRRPIRSDPGCGSD